jgi:hypothetical protein
MVDAFLDKIRRHFRFAEIFLNYGNRHPHLQEHTRISFFPWTHPTINSPPTLNRDLVRNLRHTERLPLNYMKAPDLATTLENYRIHMEIVPPMSGVKTIIISPAYAFIGSRRDNW